MHPNPRFNPHAGRKMIPTVNSLELDWKLLNGVGQHCFMVVNITTPIKTVDVDHAPLALSRPELVLGTSYDTCSITDRWSSNDGLCWLRFQRPQEDSKAIKVFDGNFRGSEGCTRIKFIGNKAFPDEGFRQAMASWWCENCYGVAQVSIRFLVVEWIWVF